MNSTQSKKRRENKLDPIAEVTAQLKLLSTKRQLDLSTVFLSSKEFTEVTRSFKKCEKPQNSRIGLGFCELSSEDETNLNLLLEECSELKILNTLSKSGFSGFFEKTKNRMEKLEILGTDFQDESKIVFILNNSPNLNVLRLSGLHVFSSLTADSMIPSAIIGLNSLIKLDLSFNSSWISEETYIKMFQNLRNLEELKINETKIDCQFESDWLPNISSFSARSSILQWDSVFEWLSILEKIFFVDVRYCDIDLILPEELKNARPMVECFY
uniref:RNI-like protein n=1 Tax=Caenorhabditis tropicalis TaxID=1561998 RepID=A0A1I7UXV9_9PELO